MEDFNVTINGRSLTVKPQDTFTFFVFEGDAQLAILHATQDDDGGYGWSNPSASANHELDALIGKAIEVYLPQV
jgi:hypothetical protein